jgi:hypothetical protein
MFTWIAIYAALKFWLPLFTGLGVLVRCFIAVRNGLSTVKAEVGEWANTLLDNHMAHIQSAAEDAASCMREMADTNREVAQTMRAMREDFQRSQQEGLRVQHELLTGLEVVKTQTR